MLDQPFIDEVSATNHQKKNMDHHREMQQREPIEARSLDSFVL